MIIKFANGNILKMHISGGYKIWNMIKPVGVKVVAHCYVFSKNMVYREAL